MQTLTGMCPTTRVFVCVCAQSDMNIRTLQHSAVCPSLHAFRESE